MSKVIRLFPRKEPAPKPRTESDLDLGAIVFSGCVLLTFFTFMAVMFSLGAAEDRERRKCMERCKRPIAECKEVCR